MGTSYVIEEVSYEYALREVRKEEEEEVKTTNYLYEVVSPPGNGAPDQPPVTTHVLAESEERAFGQAMCYIGVQSDKARVAYRLASRVTRLPLVIQGWGERTF